MGVKGMVLCPIFLLFQMASCTVTKPSSLEYGVEENATLMWNASKLIEQVRFGLYDIRRDDVSPQFVLVNPLAGVQYTNLTNTAAARYAGRVKYVGDLNLGHAWFNLANLKEDDFKETYVARIQEQGESEISYPINLTRAQAPTIKPSTTPASSSPLTTLVPRSPTTTNKPNEPTKRKLEGWVIAVIILSGIVVLVAVVLIGCYCCCRKCLADCCNRFCFCCPCKINAEGGSEEQDGEMKSKPPSAEK